MALVGRNKIIHIPLFIVAILSIGSASILIRLTNSTGITCAFWRLLISTILLIISLAARKNFKIHIDLDKAVFLVISGISLALHLVLWMESVIRIPIAISVTIVVTYPLYLSIAYAIYEKSRRSLISIAGCVLGFIGIYIYFYNALIVKVIDSVGIIQSFAASIFAAIYFHIGRILRKSLDLYSYAIPVYSLATIIVFVYSQIVNENMLTNFISSWMWFILLALLPMIGGHTVMNYLLKFYRSSTITSIALTEPVTTSILAYIIFKEYIEFTNIISLIIILIGISIVVYEDRN